MDKTRAAPELFPESRTVSHVSEGVIAGLHIRGLAAIEADDAQTRINGSKDVLEKPVRTSRARRNCIAYSPIDGLPNALAAPSATTRPATGPSR
jgi:hypothetical protein